jgi:Flp pilus assembly pilin Flp
VDGGVNLFVVKTWLRARWAPGERGANLVEYLLLLSLIAIAVMGAVLFFAGQLSPKFNQAGSQLSQAGGP